MGPKKKEAREKQKREELERKAREEEEQLRTAELKQRELEEKKRRAKEERQRLRAEEEQKFAEITEKLNEELQYKQDELRKWKVKQLEKLQWKSFTGNGAPHPSDERSMNTYLSLSQENLKNGTLSSVMREYNGLLQICDDTQLLIDGDGLPEPTSEEISRYETMLYTIRTAMMDNLKRCTMEVVMGEPNQYLGPDGHNILVESQTMGSRIVYCLWGNVAKDPRYAEIMFEKTLGFGFELPRRLLYEDVAIKIVIPDFDLLSPQCHTYRCPQSRLTTTESVASAVTVSEGEDEEVEDIVEDEGDMKKGLETLLKVGNTKRKRGSRASSARSVRHQRINSAASSVRGGEGGGKVTPTNTPAETSAENKEEGEPAGEADVNGETVEGPAVAEGEGAKKDLELKEDEINLRTHALAGKVFHLELLSMPPETKIVGTWKIRQVFSKDKVISYPHPPANVLAPVTSSHQTPNLSQDLVEFKDFKLPENFLFTENPVLGQWDDKEKMWRTEGIKDPEYNMEERTVAFKTLFFSPIAFFVDRYCNMPYQNWELHAKGVNHTEVCIEGAVTSISVKIQENVSTLIGPVDQPHLSHLINEPMTAQQLKDGLKKAGSYFFPEVDTSTYSSVTKKRSAVEMESYRSMALASSGYSFSWSHWNSTAPIGRVVVGVSLPEKRYVALYVGGRKSYKLKVMEDSETFSLDPREGAVRNPGLYASLEHDASSATKEALKTTTPMHMEAVLSWLTATKPLTLA